MLGGPLLLAQAQPGLPQGAAVSFAISGAVFLNSGFQQPDRAIGITERAAESTESQNTRKEPGGKSGVLGRDSAGSAGNGATDMGQAGSSLARVGRRRAVSPLSGSSRCQGRSGFQAPSGGAEACRGDLPSPGETRCSTGRMSTEDSEASIASIQS